jgi:hypothetical protein
MLVGHVINYVIKTYIVCIHNIPQEHVNMINKKKREIRNKRIQVMVTPAFKHKLESFLGPVPMSRFFSILAEQAMGQVDCEEDSLYKMRRRSDGDGDSFNQLK